MINSILDDVKKALGITADITVFDPDVIMHINSAFATLHQLGLGPIEGFMIEDNVPTWDAFISNTMALNSVKTYVYLSVRYNFDPPQQSAHLSAIKASMTELEWRLNVVREGLVHGSIDPGAGNPIPNDGIFDGGGP